MPAVKARAGGAQSPPATPTPSSRLRAVRAALTAAGVPEQATARELVSTFETTQGGHADRLFAEKVVALGPVELHTDGWPTDATALAGEPAFRQEGLYGSEGVYDVPGGCAYVVLSDGEARVRVAVQSREQADEALASFRGAYPALEWEDSGSVPVTFWSLGRFGPEPHTRLIDVAPWADVEGNYTADVKAELARLVGDGFDPGAGGQLLLWQGPPGTGKTWALRALASEWRGWADFHYVTDPDAFFGTEANYMVQVLLHQPHDADGEARWRVLILEDSGELLAADAKRQSGQGLSRLLNVVDGMIGQGLRVLALITTNDELGDLHPAVQRPGRCASKVVFGPLTPEEASDWLDSPVDAPLTLAELYAASAWGASDDGSDPVAGIRAVAEEHAPDGGYGETSWNEGTRTVFWNHADWTSDEEHDAAEAAFLAIDGVRRFECDSEANAPEGGGWAQVWPEPDAPARADDAALELARRPL